MIQQKDSNDFLVKDQKDKSGKFVMKTLQPKEKKVYENIPGINQPMMDGAVQVL